MIHRGRADLSAGGAKVDQVEGVGGAGEGEDGVGDVGGGAFAVEKVAVLGEDVDVELALEDEEGGAGAVVGGGSHCGHGIVCMSGSRLDAGRKGLYFTV